MKVLNKDSRRVYACTAMRRRSKDECMTRLWGCSGVGWCDFCWKVYGTKLDMDEIEEKVKERWK